jgi:hypothetical protein
LRDIQFRLARLDQVGKDFAKRGRVLEAMT